MPVIRHTAEPGRYGQTVDEAVADLQITEAMIVAGADWLDADAYLGTYEARRGWAEGVIRAALVAQAQEGRDAR